MKTAPILTALILVTSHGDHLLDVGSHKPAGPLTPAFAGGTFIDALTAAGWRYLSRSLALAAMGAFCSAAVILIRAGPGFFLFSEPFGMRRALASPSRLRPSSSSATENPACARARDLSCNMRQD